MNLTFDSNFKIGNTFCSSFSQEVIKNEPMFFNCDLDFSYMNGGPITKRFIEKLRTDYKDDFVFDSRVHMLMKGWHPCIPGYHHDDVARGSNGQPDYFDMPYKANHIMGLVNGEICPTTFAIGNAIMSDPTNHSIVYKVWHQEIETQLEKKILTLIETPSNKLIEFDCFSFHTGIRARHDGWRWFGRASSNTGRIKYITNEIRRQVQVYLEFPMEGW